VSSSRVEVLLWANRTIAKKSAEPHQLLDIQPDATIDQAQEAFHKLARIAHPDLHRTTLNAAELELVTTAYAHAANAYQQFRTARLQTTKLAAVKPAGAEVKGKRGGAISLPGGGVIRGTGTTRPPPSSTSPPPLAAIAPRTPAAPPTPTPAVLVPEPPTPTAAHASGQMNSKALLYYRKAESALRQGDIRGGTLNLKMAIAADPQSTFLRAALSEVEAELKK
jgi:hypothetical protein